jgi:hypothetical protein
VENLGLAAGLPMPLGPETSWWDRGVVSHPPIEARVAALGRMGSGISPEAVEAARQAGNRFRAAIGSPPQTAPPATSGRTLR